MNFCGRDTMPINREKQGRVLEGIRTCLCGEKPEFCFAVEHAVGEALANIGSRKGDAFVEWRMLSDGAFVVTIGSPQYRDNYDKLREMLDFARECIQHDVKNTMFVEDEHGLGHYMIAGLPTDSSYSPEGILTLGFTRGRLPDQSQMGLVA